MADNIIENQEDQPIEEVVEDIQKVEAFEDIKTYDNLKVHKLYANLPVYSSVPTHVGQEGEVVIYGGQLYIYSSGSWTTSASGFTSRVRAFLNTARQTIPQGQNVRVKFNSEDFDGDNEFNSNLVTGTATATTSDKLVDSGAFTEAEAYYVGMSLWNTTDDTYAVVTAKDDDNTLSISVDIMADTETYELYMSRFYPATTGYYQVNAAVQWVDTENLRVYSTFIYVDGSDYTESLIMTNSAAAAQLTCSVSDIVYMAAGSYLEIFARNGGSADDDDLEYRNEKTYLSIHRLS